MGITAFEEHSFSVIPITIIIILIDYNAFSFFFVVVGIDSGALLNIKKKYR